MSEDTYTHGHQPSVMKSHTWRTAENSAGFLLPYLAASTKMLDVGCGPATITCDFASRVASVIGIEPVEGILEKAKATVAERDATNVSFEVGSVYDLRFDDDTFDVSHAHQVLQHLTDPVQAIREMVRVTKPFVVGTRCRCFHERNRCLDRYLAVLHRRRPSLVG